MKITRRGGLQFINEVTGGNIPKEFIPSVQKGFQTAMKNGVLAGFPMDSLKVTLLDGSFHPVDSDQLSFEICAIQAYKNACSKGGSCIDGAHHEVGGRYSGGKYG